ncbi:DUF4297 domain-containing protein [bacterium]|nr:DUF4297 domain-containing protein [bacterium]
MGQPPTPAATSPDPALTPDKADPGDQTGRNFRYQHAYGVILLAASASGTRPYTSIWCEQHEDFLAERQDGRYDGYQIKTSRPENGAWRMNDDDLVKSVRRFVSLVKKFGDRIGQLYFVSNTEYDQVTADNKDEKRRGRQPLAFLTHVKACPDHTAIKDPFLSVFSELQAACGCVATELHDAIKRMELVPGPSRDSFHPVVAHQHLPTVPGCAGLSAAELAAWCDRLIATVCACSSLAVNDPLRHLEPLFDGTGLSAAMAAKRLRPAELMLRPTPEARPFEFTEPPTIDIGTARNPNVLKAKLEGGDLKDHVDFLSQRERDTERHLMAEILRKPEKSQALLRRLQEVVGGECSEAHLRARVAGQPYGPRMMIDVQDRLRRIAKEEPARVAHQSYDCLIGMVALLTSACRVWWCPEFPIQEPAA